MHRYAANNIDANFKSKIANSTLKLVDGDIHNTTLAKMKLILVKSTLFRLSLIFLNFQIRPKF